MVLKKHSQEKNKGFDDKALARFSDGMAMLLSSGIYPERALRLLAGSGALPKEPLLLAADLVEDGITLPGSLGPQACGCPEFFEEAVRSGEKAGRLPEAFSFLKFHYEAKGRIRTLVFQHLHQMLLSGFFSGIVLFLLSAFMLPAFDGMLVRYGLSYDAGRAQEILFILAVFLSGLLAASSAGVLLFVGNGKMGRFFPLLLKFRMFRDCYGTYCAFLESSVLSMLLSAGCRGSHAFAAAADLMPDPDSRDRLMKASERADAGEGLFSCAAFLSDEDRARLHMAELSGREISVLSDFPGAYAAAFKERAESAFGCLEGILTGVLCGLGGLVLLLRIWPLFAALAGWM